MISLNKTIAIVTMEFAVSAGLAVIVLFVIIGLVNNSISKVVSYSKFSNIFNNNLSKSEYTLFHRDYSSFVINIE